MQNIFEHGDKALFRDVCGFAVGVNSRLSDINIPAKESVFWADSIIKTHQSVPGKSRHQDRCQWVMGIYDLVEEAMHSEKARTVDIMRHLDRKGAYDVKPFELRIIIESAIAAAAIPEEGRGIKLNVVIKGFEHLKSYTCPDTGANRMPWGMLAYLIHSTFKTGPITPSVCLMLTQVPGFSEGLKASLTALANVGGVDREASTVVEYASTIDKVDEALFFFAFYGCLAVAELTAEQSEEGMFGPEGFHSCFFSLPYYEFFAGHGGRMPLLRAALLLASILYPIAERRKLGPAAVALV